MVFFWFPVEPFGPNSWLFGASNSRASLGPGLGLTELGYTPFPMTRFVGTQGGSLLVIIVTPDSR